MYASFFYYFYQLTVLLFSIPRYNKIKEKGYPFPKEREELLFSRKMVRNVSMHQYSFEALIARCPSRLGILGGSFDPIHNAHLELASQARAQFYLDEVLLLVSGDPPHKSPSANKEHRFAMANLAAQGREGIYVSRIELERSGTIYTIDTLRQLRCALPDTELFYIIGADTLLELPTWREAKALYQLTSFIVFLRPGSQITSVQLERVFGSSGPRPSVLYGHIEEMPIASRDIRRRITQGLSVSSMLPAPVRGYIEENGLYRDCSMTFNEAILALKKALQRKPQRYAHTLGVVETAEKLAYRYGADPASARWAALLHDCAKGFSSEEALSLCAFLDVQLDEIMRLEPGLIHGPLGAALAKEQYGIQDSGILEAICYHTTGKRKMSLLDKIVYLADAIEPRRLYPGVEEIRQTALTDLDQALKDSMDSTITFVLQRGGLLHPFTVDARNQLVIQLNQRQETL